MINLKKGENIALDSTQYSENNIFIGLSWYIKDSSEFDIDVSAFLLSHDNKVRSNKDFIFYNQPTDSDKCISLHMDPTNENIIRAFNVSLSDISVDVKEIIFVLTIDQAETRQQNFSMIDAVSISIYDNDKEKNELIRYDVNVENKEISLIVGTLYSHKKQWKFRAIGQGFNKGLEIIANNYNVDLPSLPQEKNENNVSSVVSDNNGLKRKRRSSKQILLENSMYLLQGFKSFLPTIHEAVEKNLNESTSRMILDKIFIGILGYKMEEIKAEQKIQGAIADYVLAINDVNMMVVKVEKAGMPLGEKQIFQATSYGAYSGIRWALLTNLIQWQLYHVSTQDKVESTLVFSVDLSTEITQQDADLLVLISRFGLNKKNLIKQVWEETLALSEDSIVSSILTDDVITKIRLTIKKDKNIHIENAKIQQVLEKILNVA